MIIDCAAQNLIAYEYQKDQYTLNPIYRSGEKDEDKPVYKFPTKSLPTIVLEDDIINPEGYGLRKGFYNIVPNDVMDMLLIYQMGQLKARVPVIKMELDREEYGKKQEPPKKMSSRRYQRKLEKERRKYYKGENPSEMEYKTAQIKYFDEKDAWIIEYVDKDVKLYGMIKF